MLLAVCLYKASAFSQTQIPYNVASITALKNYSGNANRITVTVTGQEFLLCTTCVSDENFVYAGIGGRKWKKITHTSQDITDFNTAVSNSPALASKASTSQITAERSVQAELTNKTLDFGPGKGNVISRVPFNSLDTTGKTETFDPTSIPDRSLQNALSAINANLKNVAVGLTYYPLLGSIYGSNDLYGGGEISFSAMYFNKGDIVNGLDYLMYRPGNYTAQNYNGLLLFAISGNNLTLVAQTANSPDIWKTPTYNFVSLNFTSPYVIPASGIYYAGAMYSSTTPGTDVVAPQLTHLSGVFLPKLNRGFTGNKFMYGKGWYGTQPPATIAISNISSLNSHDPAYVWSH